jgi:hypothetical protein
MKSKGIRIALILLTILIILIILAILTFFSIKILEKFANLDDIKQETVSKLVTNSVVLQPAAAKKYFPEPFPEPLEYRNKKLLKGSYLELVGGFSVPEINIGNTRRKSLYLDLLPGTNKWITAHPNGYVVELTEPSEIGIGKSNNWPELKIGQKHRVLNNIKKLAPSGVLWLNDKEVLTSGRKSYRSGFVPTWVAKVNLVTGFETRYSIKSKANTENDNFHLLQALGSGFMRITDKSWSKKNMNGAEFLLGRGGYDVLGSPLGPALGYWEIGDSYAKLLLDFPHNVQPARRDPYYIYPSRDPNTYAKAQLPIWRTPDSEDGYWQAGDVGGIAFINHPLVKGVLITSNYGRGLHDYRAQGDAGSSKYFLVKDPAVFYSGDVSIKRNRGGHIEETANSTYPQGTFARVGYIMDPAALTKVLNKEKLPWETHLNRFEWPKRGLLWSEENKNHTEIRSATWDNKRQLLWVVIGNRKLVNLVAYKIIPDDSRSEELINVSEEWRSIVNSGNVLKN